MTVKRKGHARSEIADEFRVKGVQTHLDEIKMRQSAGVNGARLAFWMSRQT